MKRAKGEEGFSLIEVTIAALLTVGLVGAVFGLLNRNQQVFITETGVTDMNQNIRTAVDLLTRDIQSAGMGLPSRNPGSFAAIFYTDGASNAPDKLMMANGDPYAPTADVKSQDSANSKFLCLVPPDVTITGSGTSQLMTYLNASNTATPIFRSFSTTPRSYIVYDDNRARVMTLTANAQITGAGANTQLELPYNAGTYSNPASVFGSSLDTAAPDYTLSKVAMLTNLVAYRLNQTNNELERTEDLATWYTVARGIVDLQVEYRIVTGKDPVTGNDIESMTSAPTDRSNIRSVLVKIVSETPDLQPKDKGYRRAVQKFEVTPRNFNLLNNTNLSAPIS
jgi:Tfp pilus assembly protein PilW